MEKEPIKILIVDDHQLVVDGFRSLLDDAEGFKVVGEANDGKEALKLLKAFEVDILMVDIDMPIMNGIETTKEVLKEHPEVKVLALTQHNEKGMIKKMMETGAKGYLLKNAYREELLGALKKVAGGKEYFSGEALMTLNKEGHNSIRKGTPLQIELSQRETEILKNIAEGLSNKEIGEKLFISPRTVDTHRTNLMRKLEVNNVAGLIRFALKNGYVD